MKYEEHRLAERIIKRFRARPGWIPNHSQMKFGKTTIGYYDTKEKDDYFVLKHADIEFTSKQEGYTIAFKKFTRQSTFDLLVWLNQLEVLTRSEPIKVVIDGVEYQPAS